MITLIIKDCEDVKTVDDYANSQIEEIIDRLRSFCDSVSDYRITIVEN